MAEAATRNTVDCEREATSDGTCSGTRKADRLLDEDNAFTRILGKGGNDLYIEYGGSNSRADDLYDSSTTSDDTYRIANSNFVGEDDDPDIDEDGELEITDEGGEKDTLDLRSTNYESEDCDPRGVGDDLFINCTGDDDILVHDYCEAGKQNFIELFRFDDGDFRLPKREVCDGGATSSANSISSQDQEQTTASQRQEAGAPTANWEQVK